MRFFLSKKTSLSRSKPRQSQRIKPTYYSGSKQEPKSNQVRADEIQRRSLKSKIRHLVNYFGLLLLGIALIFCTLLKPDAKVVVSDNSYHPSSQYESAIKKALGGLRNHSKITLDRTGISNSLRKQFPELDAVHIGVPLVSQILTVHLDVAAPTFNFASGNNLLIVGANGVVVSQSAQLNLAAKLPTLIDQSGFEAVPGKQVLGTNSIDFINTLIAQAGRAKVEINSLTLPAAPQELDLRTAGSSYFVKFDLNGDVLTQIGQYLAAKHKFDTEGNQPQQYLDVRVTGRVYYK